MKRILYILPYFELGGTERHLINLVSQIGKDNQVTLLTPEGLGLGLLSQLKVDLKLHHFPRLDQGLLAGISGFKKALKEVTQQAPVDLVHIHGGHELLFLAKGKVGGAPFVFTNHGFHGDSLNLSYKTASWICNRAAEAVICVSEFEAKKMLKSGLSQRKLFVIHNGVAEGELKSTPEELCQRFSLPQDKLLIGTVARLVKIKGIEYLLDAFSGVIKRCPNAHLVIAGTGEELTNLKEQAQLLNISEHVSFTGYVKEAQALMNIFDIFTLPSLEEPFGMVCAEAMACSKPVVASNVGGIPEIVVPQETGFLVPPQDAIALEESLVELILEQKMRERFGRNGRRRFEENFTIEKMGSRTQKLYEKLWRES